MLFPAGASLLAALVFLGSRGQELERPVAGDGGGGLPGGLLLRYAQSGFELGISNLVATWPELQGTGFDLKQDNGRSKPYRAAFVANGRPALSFDGDDHLHGPEHGMPAGSSTRAFAVRIDDLQKGGVILGAMEGNAVRFAPASPYPRFEQGGATLVSSVAVPLGQFVALMTTWDAGTGEARILLDGALVAQGVLPPLTDDAIAMGATKLGGWALGGYVAEALVFDHVLSTAEQHLVQTYLGVYTGSTFPKVEILGLPRDAQVLQRDDTGFGQLKVTGKVLSPAFQSIALRVLREGSVFDTAVQPLAYGADGAPFELDSALEAGVFDHELQVFLVQPGGSTTMVARRENVVAGDVYLVDGQSNAVAKDWKDEQLGDLHQSHWIRSFGDARYVWGYIPPIVVSKADHNKDLHWDVATSIFPHGHCTIGQWSLRMAEILMDGAQIPVAVINGGVEGSAIQYHLRNDLNPTDPAGIYGRLLYRAQNAGVDQQVKALIYYQGESDGLVPDEWQKGFDDLQEDWQTDYPALEHIYAVQIREGCGLFNDVVVEIQRQLPQVYPKVTVMSTTAVPGHDGCHYYYVGYQETGQRMARMLGRDFYGTASQDVAPPMITKAVWASPQHDLLLLTFGPAGDTLHADADVAESTFVNDATEVVDVQVASPNQLLVQLAGPSTATTISWRGHAFDGPWITNANGVGALAFFEFPITP
jgi:hypothetical protein